MFKRFMVQEEIIEPNESPPKKTTSSSIMKRIALIIGIAALILGFLLLLDIALGLFLTISGLILIQYFYRNR